MQVVVQAQLLQAQIAGIAFPEGRGFGVVGVVAVGKAREPRIGVLGRRIFYKKQLACTVWRRRLRAWACPSAARSPTQP